MKNRTTRQPEFREIIFFIALVLCIPLNSEALDTFHTNPRAMGMGGAFVASVDDTSAQYYNPAAFGFMARKDNPEIPSAMDNNGMGQKVWGFDLGAAVGYKIHNDMGKYLNDLSDINIDELSQNGIQNESDLKNLINLANNLQGLDDPGNAISVDMSAAAGVRVKNFAIGGRGMFQASGRVIELDTTNLGISSADLNAEINNVTLSGNDGQVLLFTPEQQTILADAGLDAGAIQQLDYAARVEGVSASEASQMVDLLADVADQTISGTGGDLEDNTTTVLLKGFYVHEIPLSYGYALNDGIAVGGNLKYMVGRVYATEVVVFNNDAGDILSEADREYEESSTFGVDLGVMARIPKFNFGVVARNINSPEFDGPTVNGNSYDSVTIDPQVTAGVAFFPFKNLKLEADMDLTSNDTALDDYQTQNLSLGLEWDVWRFLALRAGAYKNTAEDDIGWVYTLGLGVNFWGVRLDLAGAFSSDKTKVEDDEIPTEARLAAQLSFNF